MALTLVSSMIGQDLPPVSVSYASPGDSVFECDLVVPVSTTNQLQGVSILRANIKSVLIYSNTTVTLKTNSSSSPAETITITGGGPAFSWALACGITLPFSANLTAFYWTNGSSTVAATVNIRIGYNAG